MVTVDGIITWPYFKNLLLKVLGAVELPRFFLQRIVGYLYKAEPL